jgi:hypothetical protein
MLIAPFFHERDSAPGDRVYGNQTPRECPPTTEYDIDKKLKQLFKLDNSEIQQKGAKHRLTSAVWK